MNRIWGKLIKFFGGLTPEEVSKMVSEKATELLNEELKWGKGLKNSNGSLEIYDPFYDEFNEATKENKELMKRLQELYKKRGIRGFSIKDKRDLINLMASSGWEPMGFGSAWSEYGIPDELEVVQRASWKRFHIDPLAKGIVRNYMNFTIGKGVKVTSPVEEVEKVINKFRLENKLSQREKDMVKATFIQGEYFLRYLIYQGKVFIRAIKPNRVEEIMTKEDDDEIVFLYKILPTTKKNSYYIKDIDYDKNQGIFDVTLDVDSEVEESGFIQHIALRENGSVRGVPQLYVILRYLKYYEDWIIDRLRLNHERAKVVWIKSISSNKSMGASGNSFRAPKGGIMLEETPNVRYRIESAKLDARDAKEDGLALLYLIGSGVDMPLHVLNQRTSEEVYASLRKADTPFSQMIEEAQEFWRSEWMKMYRFVLMNTESLKDRTFKIPIYEETKLIDTLKLINSMVLDKKSEEMIIKEASKTLGKPKIQEVNIEEVPISINFPQVVKENPLELAKVLYLHKKMGIVSTQTLSERAGYDWKEELLKGVGKPEKDDGGDSGIKI